MKKDKAVKVDDNWEIECLGSKIREVELCKSEKPEMYNKALKLLKKEAKAINSLEDLQEAANEKAAEDD